MRSYVQAAVDSELEALRHTSSGRACRTFRAAAALGRFVAGGHLDPGDAEDLVLAAALDAGLGRGEALGHIRRGLRRGAMTPRSVPPAHTGRFPALHSAAVTAPDRLPLTGPSPRPPKDEVAVVWDASSPAGCDPDVESWFQLRYGDYARRFLDAVELHDLCRALRPSQDLPRWAWSRAGGWTRSGHRIVFRLWDHTGDAASLRARSIRPDATPKSLAPSGFSVRGLVLADPLAVQLLSGFVPKWWRPRDIVVLEGEPDWLLWCGRQRECEEQGPAVFGIESGAWTPRLASRIPDGSRVAVRTHADEPGVEYTRRIAATLRDRCQIFAAHQKEASR